VLPLSGKKEAKNFASSSQFAKERFALAKKEIPP
jgi:hypothetical protein